MQKYVDNSLLINDTKFDIRVYVLLTSINPLRVYLYSEGNAQFAVLKYDKDDLKNQFRYKTLKRRPILSDF